jgi:phosphate transport system protein
MPVHLQREIEILKKRILALCLMVEDNVHLAVKSFVARDDALARRVMDTDESIDRAEVDVEEECLKILALHQPVAVDLRYIIAMLKINRDLERIGDLAVNISEYTLLIEDRATEPPPLDLGELPKQVSSMLHRSLDALMELNTSLAREVWRADDEVDSLNREMYAFAGDIVHGSPEAWPVVMLYLGVSRCLERIADHATNIAKDVIYMVEGHIVRHRGKEFKRAT